MLELPLRMGDLSRPKHAQTITVIINRSIVVIILIIIIVVFVIIIAIVLIVRITVASKHVNMMFPIISHMHSCYRWYHARYCYSCSVFCYILGPRVLPKLIQMGSDAAFRAGMCSVAGCSLLTKPTKILLVMNALFANIACHRCNLQKNDPVRTPNSTPQTPHKTVRYPFWNPVNPSRNPS